MTAGKRTVLTLARRGAPKPLAPDDLSVEVGHFDVLLPCRQFKVEHKVAVVGQISLTTEFLLRLLYSVDAMSEDDARHFFGFSEHEMTFVLKEAEAKSYIERIDGRLSLTEFGRNLFTDSDKPQIFEVEKNVERAGFDLLSMAPAEREYLSDFDFALPELELKDAEMVANASRFVPEAFRKHFFELVARRERDGGIRKSLYSVDGISPEDRFSTVVPVIAMAPAKRPSQAATSLDGWKAGHELDDRTAVVHAAAAFLDLQQLPSTIEAESAYELLVEVAGDYLKEFVTRTGLSVGRFCAETASRAGEFRVDRPTIGLVGPLYTATNRGRLAEALDHAARRTPLSGSATWLFPQLPLWGACRGLPKIVQQLRGRLRNSKDEESANNVIGLTAGKPPSHLWKAFGTIAALPSKHELPGCLEVLLIPGGVAAMLVHAPIGAQRGFPVPLGVLSFDPEVVKRVAVVLARLLPDELPLPAGPHSTLNLLSPPAATAAALE